VRELLAQVELAEPERVARAFPHELSGGMRQRAQLAMALACEPALLVADEPTSALDALTADAVLALLRKLARERELGLLLVTHDLRVVARAADRAAVMYAGRIVETAPARELLETPAHPYTRALLACAPSRAKRGQALRPIQGRAVAPHERPSGCAFRTRCDLARDACAHELPPLVSIGEGRAVACPFHGEAARR
jgi:oligopeptide/dipeptide ABC transporter ATP-binding protein